MDRPNSKQAGRAASNIISKCCRQPPQAVPLAFRVRSTVGVLLIGAVVGATPMSLYAQDDLMEEFLQGIANAADALKSLQVTAACRNQVTYETDDPEIRAQIRRNQRNREQPPEDVFTCVIDGPFTRQEGTKDDIRYVMARNERYAFALTSRDKEQEWSLNWLSECGASEANDAEIHTREQQARAILLGPYHVEGTPLAEAFLSSQFTIKEIERAAVGSRKKVKVTFDFEIEKFDWSFPDAWIICDPERNWIITEFHAQEENGLTHTILYQADVLPSGIPVGVSMTEIRDDPNVFVSPSAEKKRIITRIEGAAEIVGGAPEGDRSAFYLSYYGLDEPTFQTPWYTSGWVLLVIGGIAAAVGLVFLRRFQRRYR